ncbi:MAG: hypothetical protein JST21_17870 [Bacteroidetes bacterium]|nr:hypothetical protein [Bacteroidota bacterium]
MQSFENIHDLWQTNKEESLPDVNEMIMQIKKMRKKMIGRYFIGAVILVLTFLFIGFIGWFYHFERWTTRTGILITMLTIVMGVVFNTRLVQLLLQQDDLTLDNRKYLEQLLHFRNVQGKIRNQGIALYFILLALGLGLYMIEFAERNLYFGIGAYIITFGWIVFAWVYFHKKKAHKQEKEINEQIENLESLIKTIEKE